jgi:hypothetical protein
MQDRASEFERVPDSAIERVEPGVSFKQYRKGLQARFAPALKSNELAKGWQVLVIPEKTIVFWDKPPRHLRWLGNVGLIIGGHRKYYGVYAGDANAFRSFIGFKLNGGRPCGTGQGYQRIYQFQLEQDTLEQALQLVPLPPGRGKRASWLRLFILKGAEALSTGSPWSEFEIARAEPNSLTGKVETVRVNQDEETQIETWREGMSNYELIKKLFTVGVAYLKDQQSLKP